MKITETGIKDLLILEPKVLGDDRGFFMESYNQKVLEDNGLNYKFVQDNHSRSKYGVVRGLHFQNPPYAQTKLIRAIFGKILDVAVDIRTDSETYGKAFSIELSAENKKQLLVPKGFAHGFATLSEFAEVLYKCDAYYQKESEGGLLYNDTYLNIDWKLKKDEIITSEKDLKHPAFNDFKSAF